MPFHMVNHVPVVSDYGVKDQCLYAFLMHPQEKIAQIFSTPKFWHINVFVLNYFDYRGIKAKTVITSSYCGLTSGSNITLLFIQHPLI